MSRFGASGESGWVGGYQSTYSPAVPGTRWRRRGPIEVACTPPATMADSIPDAIDAAAMPIEVRLPAQCRFTAAPGTSGIPVTTAA